MKHWKVIPLVALFMMLSGCSKETRDKLCPGCESPTTPTICTTSISATSVVLEANDTDVHEVTVSVSGSGCVLCGDPPSISSPSLIETVSYSNGTLKYRFKSPNTGGEQNESATICGKTLSIKRKAAQQPQQCTVSVDPADGGDFPSGGGGGYFKVNTQSGCYWTAASDQAWLNVTNGNGVGSGQVTYSVQFNPNTQPPKRDGRITVLVSNGTATHTVHQLAAPPQNCTPSITSVSPTGGNLGYQAGSGSITWTVPSSCSCSNISFNPSSVVSNVNTTSVTNGGTTTYTTTFNYSENGSSQRDIVVSICGITYRFTQNGAPVNNPSVDLKADGQDNLSVAYNASVNLSWVSQYATSCMASNAWSGSKALNGNENVGPLTNTRVYTITCTGANGQTASDSVTVTVANPPNCTPSITSVSPTGGNLGYQAGSGSITWTVPSGCSCNNISFNQPWVTNVNTTSTTNGGTITYTTTFNYSGNPGSSTRDVTVSICGVGYTFTQSGAPVTCDYALELNVNVPAAGGNRTLRINTSPNTGCPWTASTTTPWIHLTGATTGNGDGEVQYTVDPNSGAARTGTISAAGKTVTINQAAGTVTSQCVFAIETDIYVPYTGGNRTLPINTSPNTGCPWTASTDNAVMIGLATTSGNGDGEVQYTVSGNNGAARTAKITVTVDGVSQTATVHQEAKP